MFLVKLVKRLDRIIDNVLLILLSAWLVYGLWALYDTYRVYENAGTQKFIRYKPQPKPGKKGIDPEQFSELASINDDIVAWVTVDDSNIDYPVVQGKDVWEYVTKSFEGEFSVAGCPFLDTENRKDFSDPYNLVYGHHVDHGMMFGDLDKFVSYAHFKEHRTGTLYTRAGEVCALEWVACCYASAYDGILFMPGESRTKDGIDAIYEEIEKTAVQKILKFKSKIKGHRLIALSTCAEDGTDNMRIILIGRILEEDEHVS